MRVSDERVERAARALFEACAIRWAPTWPDTQERIKNDFRKEARAALEADTPALEAARVEGVREARKAVEKCSSYEDRALYLHAIDARLSEMNQQPVDEGSVEQ